MKAVPIAEEGKRSKRSESSWKKLTQILHRFFLRLRFERRANDDRSTSHAAVEFGVQIETDGVSVQETRAVVRRHEGVSMLLVVHLDVRRQRLSFGRVMIKMRVMVMIATL